MAESRSFPLGASGVVLADVALAIYLNRQLVTTPAGVTLTEVDVTRHLYRLGGLPEAGVEDAYVATLALQTGIGAMHAWDNRTGGPDHHFIPSRGGGTPSPILLLNGSVAPGVLMMAAQANGDTLVDGWTPGPGTWELWWSGDVPGVLGYHRWQGGQVTTPAPINAEIAAEAAEERQDAVDDIREEGAPVVLRYEADSIQEGGLEPVDVPSVDWQTHAAILHFSSHSRPDDVKAGDVRVLLADADLGVLADAVGDIPSGSTPGATGVSVYLGKDPSAYPVPGDSGVRRYEVLGLLQTKMLGGYRVVHELHARG